MRSINVSKHPSPILVMTLMGAQTLWASTFRVSPTGNDQYPNGPWPTIDAALAVSRQSAASGPHTIMIDAGVYHVDSPIVLTPQDSGLTLQAASGAHVAIYGGPLIQNWRKQGDHLYAAPLPGVKEGTWDFRTLVVNGRTASRARYPQEGTLTHVSRFDVRWMSTTGGGWQRKPTEQELTTMRFKPEDIGPDFEVRNAEIRVYHMWDDSLVGVKSIDRQSNRLTFSSPTGHPAGAFNVHKYVIFNTRAGLTRPGQWMLDRAQGRVVYWPLPGEDMSRIEVIAPRVESIFRVEGTLQDPVRDVTIQGLTLAATTTPLKAGGFGAGRFDGAVNISHAKHCRLLDLDVVDCGGQGINVRGGGVRIERCHVHQIGACGIRAGGCTVHDNTIDHVGLTYPSAIGVVGGHDTLITHNEIHDTPYSAINCGGRNSRIEANHIHRAMQVLHDGGGIYCFAGKNMILRGNRIHDITDTGGYGASAYYLDERSEGCVVEGNLSYNVAWPSHNHMALKNTIRNNVFVYDGDMQLTFPRCTEFQVEHNVMVATGSIKFTNVDEVTLRRNVLFSGTGQVTGVHLKDYSATGQETIQADESNSMVDPKLVDYETGRVRFAAGSCTEPMGISALDVSNAGRRSPPASMIDRADDGLVTLWLSDVSHRIRFTEQSTGVHAGKQGDLPSITVDPDWLGQTMDGFGFALTGGSALHLRNMSVEDRTALLIELFDHSGDNIGISYLRVSIGASDLDAKYFVKYVQEMASEGIVIDAITIQNEPLHPGNNPSLLMLAEEQAEFIKQSLGPAFEQADLKTKIIIYDHNADTSFNILAGDKAIHSRLSAGAVGTYVW